MPQPDSRPPTPLRWRRAAVAAAVFAALCGLGFALAEPDAAAPAEGRTLALAPVRSAAPVLPPARDAARPAPPPAPAAPAPVLRAAAPDLGAYELPADFVPANTEGSTEDAPFGRIFLPAVTNGEAAVAALGADLPAVAAWYGHDAAEFTRMLLDDRTLHVDRRGRVLYIDAGTKVAGGTPAADGAGPHGHVHAPAPDGTEAADVVSGNVPLTGGAPLPLDQTFALHSRSSASRVIYLNFRGEGTKPAFSLDAAPNTFTDAEKALIQRIWLRVAEDYAAFDVDVTTEPPPAGVRKTGVTILITKQASDAGGYAYLNAFAAFRAAPAPAFCFQNNLANAEKPIAECISHEVGHTLGLRHQGTKVTAYFGGSGDGETGWAPIMGVSYNKNLTQWAKGEFAGATNTEDAYAVMLRQGLPPRADDHGNSRGAATRLPLAVANGFSSLRTSGVLERPGDVDVFAFAAGAGDLTLRVAPSAWSGNLDLVVELQDAAGRVLATANPAAELAATVRTRLAAAGSYFAVVRGTGKGDPRSGGYSAYGAVGQYQLTGTAALPPAGR